MSKKWQLTRWIISVHYSNRHFFWLLVYSLKTIDPFDKSNGHFKSRKFLANKCFIPVFCNPVPFPSLLVLMEDLPEMPSTLPKERWATTPPQTRWELWSKNNSYAEPNFHLCYSFPKPFTATNINNSSAHKKKVRKPSKRKISYPSFCVLKVTSAVPKCKCLTYKAHLKRMKINSVLGTQARKFSAIFELAET